jgi:hypothetical protein
MHNEARFNPRFENQGPKGQKNIGCWYFVLWFEGITHHHPDPNVNKAHMFPTPFPLNGNNSVV